MIIPDANLLIYAADQNSPHHQPALAWWTDVLNGTTPIGLDWGVLLAYVRILSNPRMFASPADTQALLDDVEAWAALPHVTFLRPGPNHIQALRSMFRHSDSRGDLVNDAHLAGLAIGYSGTIYSTDRDFARFTDIRWVNPLTSMNQ